MCCGGTRVEGRRHLGKSGLSSCHVCPWGLHLLASLGCKHLHLLSHLVSPQLGQHKASQCLFPQGKFLQVSQWVRRASLRACDECCQPAIISCQSLRTHNACLQLYSLCAPTLLHKIYVSLVAQAWTSVVCFLARGLVLLYRAHSDGLIILLGGCQDFPIALGEHFIF